MRAAIPPGMKDFEVGMTIGHLTITSLKPFTQRCSCGRECRRTRTAIITNGVRSCGCAGGRILKREPGNTVGIYLLIAAIGDRKWHVECVRCKTRKTVSENNLYASQRRCSACSD